MLKTINNVIACKPINIRSHESVSGFSLNADKKMFELEVILPDEKGDFQPGDNIYLDRAFEYQDSAAFLKTPVKIGDLSCILVPREFIRAHKTCVYNETMNSTGGTLTYEKVCNAAERGAK